MPKKIIIVALFGLALALSACASDSPKPSSSTKAGGDPFRTALEAAHPTQFGAVADKLSVRGIARHRAIINVAVNTPDGGFQGASRQDLAGSAGAAFKALHGAGWHKAITVTFKGGLVDTTTGKNLPNAETGVFRLDRKDARRIDWQHADQVDWTVYAVFLHPALKR
ncbi:hypothetical protein [Candidatus Solirubrobacter pratensis]|uniref:hypothetical protein n=1 Tax=Candidatus Solirubrobacter pratensis TaxID=1298857 RepID=UPI0004181DF1|nr:hypothetical protein [Candidatus Solirubrobacter pratensis]